MKFVYENRKEIDEQYLHDSYFEGFQYDYDKRQIYISCIDGRRKKVNHLYFENVIFLEMQSCQFWAPGNSIYDIWNEDDSDHLKKLIDMEKTINVK